MSTKRRSPASAGRAASTSPNADSNLTASQQVNWITVHRFVGEVLKQVNGWPMLGTPAWCSLAQDDPRKWAALLDGAQHWALRVDTLQAAECQASRDISTGMDWSGFAQARLRHDKFYAEKPFLKRVAS